MKMNELFSWATFILILFLAFYISWKLAYRLMVMIHAAINADDKKYWDDVYKVIAKYDGGDKDE